MLNQSQAGLPQSGAAKRPMALPIPPNRGVADVDHIPAHVKNSYPTCEMLRRRQATTPPPVTRTGPAAPTDRGSR